MKNDNARIQADHAEALEMDTTGIEMMIRCQRWWMNHSKEWRQSSLDRLIDDALEMNDEWDAVEADNAPEHDGMTTAQLIEALADKAAHKALKPEQPVKKPTEAGLITPDQRPNFTGN